MNERRRAKASGRATERTREVAVFFTARFWVRVKVTRRENGHSPGLADGPMKPGEELVVL